LGRRCCVTRRLSVWLNERGDAYDRTEAVPAQPNTPHMRAGGGHHPFLVRTVSPQHMTEEVIWTCRKRPQGREAGE